MKGKLSFIAGLLIGILAGIFFFFPFESVITEKLCKAGIYPSQVKFQKVLPLLVLKDVKVHGVKVKEVKVKPGLSFSGISYKVEGKLCKGKFTADVLQPYFEDLFNVKYEIKGVDVRCFNPDYSGKVSGSGTMKVKRGEILSGSGRFKVKDFVLKKFRFGQFSLPVNVKVNGKGNYKVVSKNTVRFEGKAKGDVDLEIVGKLEYKPKNPWQSLVNAKVSISLFDFAPKASFHISIPVKKLAR
jgi:hypothetical protein